ncbi:MAG: SBBP repeat-containing protein, partial [Candidatus Zixiibacteriota bacterium]
MKKTLTLAVLLIVSPLVGAVSSELDISAKGNLTSLPLAFTENQGQWDERVMFVADAGRATMWFTAYGACYQFTRPGDHQGGVGRNIDLSRPDRFQTLTIRSSFVGANPDPRMAGENRLDYRCNYFVGNDPTKWRIDVPTYRAVVYQQIYPGTDLKYYGNGKEMEYDFILSPGADPSQIKIQYEGVQSLSVNELGELVVTTQWGEVIERRPVVYQLVNGVRLPIEGRYEMLADNTFGFSVGADYDPTLPLVIDPVLSYSTYLGGAFGEVGYAIAVDTSGATYVTGWTSSPDFPTANPYQATMQGWGDAFITKLSSDGTSLVYSTYLGGSGEECGYSIAVDATGAVYVTGDTYSDDFPTHNPFQGNLGSPNTEDAFVTKLSSDGGSLVYSTYLGGYFGDHGRGIAVGADGSAYVTGWTGSPDFPLENPYQALFNGPTD